MELRRLPIAIALAAALSLAALAGAAVSDAGLRPPTTYRLPSSDDLQVGDINGDGHLDALTIGRDASMLFGRASGRLRKIRWAGLTGSAYGGALANMNHDGKLDILLGDTDWGDGHLSIRYGRGDGTFRSGPAVGGPGRVLELIARDFSGDGRRDIAATFDGDHDYQTDSSLIIFTAKPNGKFKSSYLDVDDPVQLASADLNGDGRRDVIAAPSYGPPSVLLARSKGRFRAPAFIDSGADWTSGMQIADVDRDRKPDLVAVNNSWYPGLGWVSVHRGNGDGTFEPPQAYLVGKALGDLALMHFNRGPALDIAAVDTARNRLRILRGTGAGTFENAAEFKVTPTPYEIEVADFNRDDRDDLAVHGRHGLSVLLGR